MSKPSLILEIEAVAHVDLMPGDPDIGAAGFLDSPAGMDLALQVGRAVLEAPDACQRVSVVRPIGSTINRRVTVKVAVIPRQGLADFLDPLSQGIAFGMEQVSRMMHHSATSMLESPPPGMRHISGQLSACIRHIAEKLDGYVEARAHG